MVSVFVLFLSAPSFEQAQKEKISAAVQRKSASAFFAVHNMVSAPCVETIIQFFANMSSIKKTDDRGGGLWYNDRKGGVYAFGTG